MPTPLIEQEIYLLERYSSIEYFSAMRDAWKAMVSIGWEALDQFMRRLPRDYRRRPLNEQPDVVWGGRVLPNITSTEEGLDQAYELLLSGDLSALGASTHIHKDLIGMGRDYNNLWMSEEFRKEFDAQQDLASFFDGDITPTINGTWSPGSLYFPTWQEEKEDMWIYRWEKFPPPPTWPIYRLNTDVQINTGEKINQTGIYLPSADNSCPMFLYVVSETTYDSNELMSVAPPYDAAPPGQARSVPQATLWTLVERIADEGGQVPGQESWRQKSDGPGRCEGGQPCPVDGNWWTPANYAGASYFKKGDIMPDYPASTYGSTIWYREKE